MKESKQYAYLSIDQLRKTYNPRSYTKNSLSEFFNIKFESHPIQSTKEDNNYLQNFRRTEKSSSLNTNSLIGKFRDNEEKRLYYSLNPRTKKLNTEKMLESISKILEKQNTSVKKTNRDSQSNKKSIKITNNEHQSPQYSHETSPKREYHQIKVTPSPIRKPLFQKMLKKCEKLKQIYKYQNELINIKHLEEDQKLKVGLRFHTEPLGVFNDSEKSELFSGYQKPGGFKKIFKVKYDTEKSQLSDSRPDRQSLDIRRYKNQSVLKQRLKYVIKKSMMNNESFNGKILRNMKWHSKRSNTKRKTREKDDKVKVGPWDEEDSIFQQQFK